MLQIKNSSPYDIILFTFLWLIEEKKAEFHQILADISFGI
jgi:hypothetical protein